MNLRFLLTAAFFFFISVAAGLYLVREKVNYSSEAQPKLVKVDNVIEANNQFAIDYYTQLNSQGEKNIFFSPFSISSAFGMAYEGARQQTAQTMRSVFYFPENDKSRRLEYSDIFNEINKEGKSYKLSVANALWAQDKYKFLEEYFSIVEKYYGGKVTNLDLENNPEGSRLIINKWVEEKTNNKIKDLISPSMMNPNLKLILTNTTYFNGEWSKKFDKNETKEDVFKLGQNNTAKVQMMQLSDNKAIFNYAENSSLQIIEFPYSGEEISMVIMLPRGNSLEKIEKILSKEKIVEWKKNLKEQRVNVFMPRFRLETSYLMSNDLKAMGMPVAFSDSADFSGMTGAKDLKIDEAVHKTFIEVGEEGTEAAAATAITMRDLAMPLNEKESKIPTFRADHPFIFLIQQKETGNILFMGKVINPAI